MKNKKACCVRSSLKHMCFHQWNTWSSSCFVHQIRVSILPKETKHWLNKRESPILLYCYLFTAGLIEQEWGMGTCSDCYSHQETVQWQLKWAAVLCLGHAGHTHQRNHKGKLFQKLYCFVQLFELAGKWKMWSSPKAMKAINKAKIYLTEGLSKISEIIAFFIKNQKTKKTNNNTKHLLTLSSQQRVNAHSNIYLGIYEVMSSNYFLSCLSCILSCIQARKLMGRLGSKTNSFVLQFNCWSSHRFQISQLSFLCSFTL